MPCFCIQQYACSYSKNGRGATATGVVTINSGDEASLMSAVATVGPISIYVDASHSSFQVGIAIITFGDSPLLILK